MSYVPPPPPPPAMMAPHKSQTDSPAPNQSQFVSVPTTPMVQPQPYYEDLVLHPHSPYSIQIDNFIFCLQQCWRIRFGCRFVVFIASMGVVATGAYVMHEYHDETRHKGVLWRNGPGQGGIDMSPVIALLAVGVLVLAFSFVMILGSWIPQINHINNLSDIITMSLSTIGLIGSIVAVAYSFQHPSLNVDFDSPAPISFRKYACNIDQDLLQSAELKEATGDPLGSINGIDIVKFRGMCGQFGLSWMMAIFVAVFEVFIIASVFLGRKWRLGLEECERTEEKLAESEKYRMRM